MLSYDSSMGDFIIFDKMLERCSEFLGNCWISDCGCPGAFLQSWCDENNPQHQMSPVCGASKSNCISCGGTWCTGETTTTEASGIVILGMKT